MKAAAVGILVGILLAFVGDERRQIADGRRKRCYTHVAHSRVVVGIGK